MTRRTVQVSWILFLTVWSIKWDFGAANFDAPSFEAAFQGKCSELLCTQGCVELHDGTFECQCKPGYVLSIDGYSCSEAVNTSLSEDSEEEWLRTNSIKNSMIHETHHDQERDLELKNNYGQSETSRLNYFPFSGNPESGAGKGKNNFHNEIGKVQNTNKNSRPLTPKKKPISFSIDSKFSFDSHELPMLFGSENNDRKLQETILDNSSENQIEREDESWEQVTLDKNIIGQKNKRRDDSSSSSQGGGQVKGQSQEMSRQTTISPLKILQDMTNLDSSDEDDSSSDEDSSEDEDEDFISSRDRITISDKFEHDYSDSAFLARPKSSSSHESQSGDGLSFETTSSSISTSSSPSPPPPTSTTTRSSSSSPPSPSSSPSPSPSSSSSWSPKEEEEEEEEASGPREETSPKTHKTDQECPLTCQNGGLCSRERFQESLSPSKSSVVVVPLLTEGSDVGTRIRCLCRLGYHGEFCEIEDGTEGEGYTSGLFRGQSWVAFPVLHDAYMSDQISLEFRPESPNGILMLTGEREDLSGDFLALYVHDSYLEFRFDCGSGSGMVRSSQPVNLQQWNRANIVRRRWDGWMQLNDGPFTQGRSKGLFSRITFRQPVFIGGAGNITFGASSSGESSPGNNNGNVTGEDGSGQDLSKSKLDESETDLETESPIVSTPPPPIDPNNSSVKIQDQIWDMSTALPILRKTGGFRGCIRNLVINDRTYRFGLEPVGDALQGLDIENCNDQGVCDLLNCQHGGQCIVQKDENPACLCPLGFTGALCTESLDLQIPSFNGSSYLKYGGLGLSRVLSWLELEVIVKPEAMDGLILYNGYKTDGMGDFISLVIDQGYFEFALDLGTGTANIRSDYPVALGEWHRILISRTSRLISMRIDNQSPIMALTPGAFTQLSLPHNLFLGGIPDPQWLSPKVKVHGGFSGCIQKLVINEKPLRIMGAAMSGVNLENCAHPCLRNPCKAGGECLPQLDSFKCHCPLGFRDLYCQTRMDKQDIITAPKLIGDSYLRFTSPRIIKRISGSRLDLSFRLRTSLSRGLILWAGRKLVTSASDFISVGLRNGFIHTSFNLGSGQTTIAYNYTTVHDGHWHLVRLVRNEQEASIAVDDGPPVIGVAPGKLRQLNINDGLFIGGLDDPRRQSMNRYTEGLVGCITDLVLGNDYRVSLLQEASEGRNIDYCD